MEARPCWNSKIRTRSPIADGLLDEGGHQARRRDRHVDAPGLVEHPLVLRVVDACHGAGHPELGLGQQREHEVDLVVTGGRDDDVTVLQAGLVERGRSRRRRP
jgi:hypothetical protein